MPSKTPAQAKLMRAVAHGWKPDRIKGPSRKVAKEFVAADKKAKGMQLGGIVGGKGVKKLFEKAQRKLLMKAQRGDEKAEAFIRKHASKHERGETVGDFGKWALEQRGQFDPRPGGDVPPRTTQPIPGEGGLLEETPPPKAVTPASLRAEIPERLRATIAGAGRTPPALLQYLQQLRGPAPEPVEMQRGGAMDFMFRGRVPQRLQQGAGRGQPPGGGGRVTADQGMQKFLQRGQVPGGGRFKGMGRGMNSLLQQIQQRRQAPGGGGPQPRPQPQPAPGPTRGPEWGGSPEANQDFGRAVGQMKGIGRAPGAGVPLRGVGRPPGMGRPGGGQGITFGERDPTGGAGMPGGANRIGMGDQQGALARAMQVQTGRPPISRRQPFPGRGGPSGGFGRRRRGQGRMRR